ncbi:AI-2E family transporter, partial [Shimia litoralis]
VSIQSGWIHLSTLSEFAGPLQTNGTARFFLSLFAFLYAMFFFLPMRTSVFSQLLSYTALEPAFQDKLNHRIISVSRATIKGSLLIGMIQGALGGMGFWLAGFEGAIFWSVIMAILAAIPAVGATPVVLGGAIFLGIEGETTKAIILAMWAVMVVGSIDNVLRPRLVGKDADMSDLWIFVSTLGGLSTFGPAGLVFGPVFAGIFITIWTELSAPKAIADNHAPSESQNTSSTHKPPGQSGLRLTATKTEMEQELADLKRQLGDRDT